MSSGDVVCTGWLIKSPPERKLKRYDILFCCLLLLWLLGSLCSYAIRARFWKKHLQN